MGLYPSLRSILSPGEQAPLSPGFLPIVDDAKDDEIGRESVHKISACGGSDPEWLHQEWPSSSVIGLYPGDVGHEVPWGKILPRS